jgi:hypothetical protein
MRLRLRGVTVIAMISDVLIPKLRERFADRGPQVGVPPDPCAVFAAINPDVGDIVISDDGYELTLEAGRFTHSHFSNYDEDLSETQRAERISEDVVQFLDDFFADRIVLWALTIRVEVGIRGTNRDPDFGVPAENSMCGRDLYAMAKVYLR